MNTRYFYNLGKKKLFPLCRSLTGKGNELTLSIIKKTLGRLKIIKFRSGKKVFDWKIPEEWNVSDAYVLDKFKKKIIDFKKNNLHLVGYSTPQKNKILSKKIFFQHLHTLPNQINAIPYVTSYYKKYWGFCVSEKTKKLFNSKYSEKDKFKILIKTSFNKRGRMLVGEYFMKGKSTQEILISTYICHPSLANDNLSGILVALKLVDHFKKIKNLKKSLRFIFLPETIGSLAYINKNLKLLKKNIIGGYNPTRLGISSQHSYIPSKYQNSPSDHALKETYKRLKIKPKKYSFLDRGSDERQYNSPGIDLPITTVFRSKFASFKEYHTSMDNFEFLNLKALNDSLKVLKKSIQILLEDNYPKSKVLGEPFMSKRGMYPTISKKNNVYLNGKLLDFLQYSDGKNNLESISKLIKLDFKATKKCFKILLKHNLIEV
jgi:aminopeptidase-like protein